jgi:hypothetical protein
MTAKGKKKATKKSPSRKRGSRGPFRWNRRTGVDLSLIDGAAGHTGPSHGSVFGCAGNDIDSAVDGSG